MPHLRYTPTIDDQLRVREFATLGMSDDDIASLLRLPAPQLRKRFRLELKEGAALGRKHLLETLHNTATSGNNATTLLFAVKALCGLRDTGATNTAPKVVRSVLVFKPKSEPQSKPTPDEQ